MAGFFHARVVSCGLARLRCFITVHNRLNLLLSGQLRMFFIDRFHG